MTNLKKEVDRNFHLTYNIYIILKIKGIRYGLSRKRVDADQHGDA